jgi:signal transduction histidine kinase
VTGRRGWPLRFGPAAVDGLLAVAMGIELELEAWLDPGIPASHRLVTAGAAAPYALCLAGWRRWPDKALVACASVAVIQAPLAGNILTGLTGALVPPLVLSFSAGARLSLRRGLVSVILAYVLLSAGVIIDGRIPEPGSYGGVASGLVGYGFLLATPWLIARLMRERARRAEAFRVLALQAESERIERERRAVRTQRARIGRELHDIIAQSLGAIIVQAGGARQMILADPARAAESILAVERTGREALADLRRTLGLLRADDGVRSLAPQPGLRHVPALLAAFHDKGLACEFRTNGEPPDMSAGVDLLAYRVIETTLSSAAGQGRGHADITLEYRPDHLELRIRADGCVADPDMQLRGLGERVVLYDGKLQVNPSEPRGFILRVQIPLGVPAL